MLYRLNQSFGTSTQSKIENKKDKSMILAILIVFVQAVMAVLAGWFYFRRYAIQRPPIGVFNLWDVAFMLTGIVLIPYLYLLLPGWLAAGVLGLAASSILYFMLEPVLKARWLIWPLVIIILVADIGAVVWLGGQSAAFFAINNLVQILVVVGVTNTWAQSGMKARDAAILGAALVGYDYLFTSVLPLMTNLTGHLAGLPFMPLVIWRFFLDGELWWLGIGLGDLLLATVFPLVMRKAYGRPAGLAALLISLCALAAVLSLPALGFVYSAFPVMVVLGPLMVGQYLYWRHRCGPERTTRQYWQVEAVLRITP
jgi:hypothetical protein